MVDQLDQVDGAIDLLEYTSTNKESFVAFNKEGDKGVHERNRVVEKGGRHWLDDLSVWMSHLGRLTLLSKIGINFYLDIGLSPKCGELQPTTVGYVELENEAAPGQLAANKVVASISEASSTGEAAATAKAATIDVSDLSTENSLDSDYEDLFVEDDVEFKSDMNKEDINLRVEWTTYQMRKKREIIANGLAEVPLGEVGLDLGFNKTKIVDKSLKGKVVGDEPVYYSSNEYSVESDSEYELGRIDSRKIIYDKSVRWVVWQLGMIF
ncbi:hypothetical protein CQW23_24182 [Capsicum baccatum]|uniref:Uncharacterized protein n=1 Tax=Capsicum baccatum TaxID=33114 RepID=A0A2G2VU49_CAPBA|nr:hypothetical protein CQW23_24182 [Capsicum baccatum]